MKTAPICSACGSFVQERRTFTDDGVVIVATVCHCGHVSSFTLGFNYSRESASIGSRLTRADTPSLGVSSLTSPGLEMGPAISEAA